MNELENSVSVFSVKRLIFQARPWVWFLPFSVLPGKFQGLRRRIIHEAFSLTSPGELGHTGRTYASLIFSVVSERLFSLSGDVH